MSMIELDIISLAIIICVCICSYLYCLKEKPYLLKYVSIGYILLLVFIRVVIVSLNDYMLMLLAKKALKGDYNV